MTHDAMQEGPAVDPAVDPVAEATVLRVLFTVRAVTRTEAMSCVEIRVAARNQGNVIDQPTGQTDRLLRDMVERGLLHCQRIRDPQSGTRRARMFWLSDTAQAPAEMSCD